VEVEHLAEGDVKGADAATDGRGEGALNADEELLERGDGVVGEPVVKTLEGLLAGVDFHPLDLAAAGVGFLHGGVEDADAGAPDVGAGAVAFDEGDDRLVGDGQLAVADENGLAAGGDDEVFEGGHAERSVAAL